MPVSTMFGAASAGKTLSRCRAYALAIFATTAPVLFVCYAGTMRLASAAAVRSGTNTTLFS